eukprot:177782_1
MSTQNIKSIYCYRVSYLNLTDTEKQLVIGYWIRKEFNKNNYSIDVIPIILAFAEPIDYDTLKLTSNADCIKMLSKMADNFPEEEQIILSNKIIKINKRGKEQQRVILVTDKAIYIMKPLDLRKCRRRIALGKIASITVLTTSDEFTIHIFDEHNHRFKCKNNIDIISIIAHLHQNKNGKTFPIQETDQESTYTQQISRTLNREQRFHQTKVTRKLIESKEDVSPDDFEFINVIGNKAGIQWFKVRKKDSEQKFVMKIILKRQLSSKQIEQFGADKKILQQFVHPFLMHSRYGFETKTKMYYVFDFVGSELLFHLKKKKRFTEKQGKIIVAETVLALGHLHSLDIIYKALRPENILINNNGHICLKDNEGLGYEYMHNGYEYMAPEIVQNLYYSKSSDWWSLGILLYELVVGIPPFYSANINEMYTKIQEAPLLFPQMLSNQCKDLITQLLQRDPKLRLGADVNDVRCHAFFDNVDWGKLYQKDIDPPYKPIRQMPRTEEFVSFRYVPQNET